MKLGRLRQEHCEFDLSLGYLARTIEKKKKKKGKEEGRRRRGEIKTEGERGEGALTEGGMILGWVLNI